MFNSPRSLGDIVHHSLVEDSIDLDPLTPEATEWPLQHISVRKGQGALKNNLTKCITVINFQKMVDHIKYIIRTYMYIMCVCVCVCVGGGGGLEANKGELTLTCTT